MKRFLMVTAASALLCGQAFAQQAQVMPTPSLAATTPLGMVPSAPVGGTGIPLGATEIASPGVSPVPTAATGTLGSTVCSTIGTAPSTMFGSAATFDGGGVAVGAVTPQSTMSTMPMAGAPMSSGIAPTSALIDTSGMSSMCGAGSGNPAASSAPTAPVAAGGVMRTGIPMGSTEIANLGVSSAAAVPTIAVAPTVSTIAPGIPTVPAVTLPAPNMTAAAPTDAITGIASITGAPNTIPGLSSAATMFR